MMELDERGIKMKFYVKNITFLIFFLTFLLRLPGAIFPPTNYIYNEIEIAGIFSVLGLFAGLIPAGVTFWSLGIYGIPLMLLYTLDFALIYPLGILSALRHQPLILIEQLSIYMANAFLNPTRLLIIGRMFVAFVTSFAPIAIFAFFHKKNKMAAAIFSTILFSTSPFLVQQNYSFLPDSIGLMFFAFALVIILQERLGSKEIFIGSIFLGLAIAAKFLYVAFLPTAFLAILFNKVNCPPVADRRSSNCIIKNSKEYLLNLTRNTLIFIAVLVLVIFIFVPFIWTAPLGLAKNLFGTLKQYYGNQNGWMVLLWGIIPSFINWLGLSFFVIGFIFSFFVLNKKTAILLTVSFLSFLIPLGNAIFILDRYALPLIPYLCIYAGIGLELLLLKVKKHNFKILLIVLVSGVIFVSNLICVIKAFKITHNNTNIMDCVNWIKKSIGPGSNIAVPENFAYFFVPSENTLERWLNNLDNSYNNILEMRLNNLFLMAGTESRNLNQDNPLVSKTFGLLEQQKAFVYKTLLWYFRNKEKPKLNYNLFLYLPPKVHKLGIISSNQEDVLKLFLEHKIDFFISNKYLPVPSTPRVKYFNRYPEEPCYLYINNGE